MLVLGLEANAETIQYSICTSKLKQENVKVYGLSLIIIRLDPSKHSHALNAELQRLRSAIPNVVMVVAGLPQISCAVIAVDDLRGLPTYKLCVESYGLRDVMPTFGVVGAKTKRNNILEVYGTLGIEAARTTIMNEITIVMEGHVDHRHIMLLTRQMTSRGEVVRGITRHGLAKMCESVINLASVSSTVD